MITSQEIANEGKISMEGGQFFLGKKECSRTEANAVFSAVARVKYNNLTEEDISKLWNEWFNQKKKENNKYFNVARVPSKIDKVLWSHWRVFIEEDYTVRIYFLKGPKTKTYGIAGKISAPGVASLPKAIHDKYTDIIRNPEKYKSDCPLGFYFNEDKTEWAKTPKNIFNYFSDSYEDMLLGNFITIEDQPKLFSNNPKVCNLGYFDISLLKEPKETPTINSFLSRFTKDQRKIFNAWLYGLVDERNTSRQVLYLHDNGFGGKSVLFKAISEFIGKNNVATMTRNDISSQFAYSKVYGKRLMVLPDLKNHNIIRSEFIHSVTGGDLVNVERKGENGFTAKVYSKVIVGSNVAPEIDPSAKHERSRLIYLKLSDYTNEQLENVCLLDESGEIKYDTDGMPIFNKNGDETVQQLLEELPYYIKRCKDDYFQLCENHGNFNVPKSVVKDRNDICVDPMLEVFQCLMENHFKKSEDGFITKNELYEKLKLECELNSVSFDMNQRSTDIRNFNKWLKQNYPFIEFQRKRIKGRHLNIIKGLERVKLSGFTTEVENEI